MTSKLNKFPYATVGILILSIIFLFLQISGPTLESPGNPDITVLGVLLPSKVLSGEWYRLLTACFLHSNGSHLIGNFIPIVTCGLLIENRMGSWRFLFYIFTIGIVGNVAWFILNMDAVNIYCLGSSGITCGLIPLATLYLYKTFGTLFGKTVANGLLFVMLANILFEIYITIYESDSNVARIVHLGSYLVGIVLGLIYAEIHRRK